MDEKMSDALNILFILIMLGLFVFLIFGSVIHWNNYCNDDYASFEEKRIISFCNDLNKWCSCWGKNFVCDVNLPTNYYDYCEKYLCGE